MLDSGLSPPEFPSLGSKLRSRPTRCVSAFTSSSEPFVIVPRCSCTCVSDGCDPVVPSSVARDWHSVNVRQPRAFLREEEGSAVQALIADCSSQGGRCKLESIACIVYVMKEAQDRLYRTEALFHIYMFGREASSNHRM